MERGDLWCQKTSNAPVVYPNGDIRTESRNKIDSIQCLRKERAFECKLYTMICPIEHWLQDATMCRNLGTIMGAEAVADEEVEVLRLVVIALARKRRSLLSKVPLTGTCNCGAHAQVKGAFVNSTQKKNGS